jgi:hypothetical protein
MRWRNGGLEPQYMSKGEVYEAYISLWNTSYVVAPGHALRFALSSSNYPRFSINYNNGILLADEAYPGDNVTANNVVHHSFQYASYIDLPVVNKLQIPQVHGIKAEFEMAYPQLDYDMIIKKGPELLNKMIMGNHMGGGMPLKH